MSTRRHIVRLFVLGLSATPLAFAQPVVSLVPSAGGAAEVRHEKLAHRQFRIDGSVADTATVQLQALASEQEMRWEKAAGVRFRTDRRIAAGFAAIQLQSLALDEETRQDREGRRAHRALHASGERIVVAR